MIVKYLLKIAMLGSSWVMYLLLALSVASIGAMVDRWLYFRKRGTGGEALGDELCRLLEEGDGDLPGDPYRLLPVNSDDFYALAKRAGLGHYRYQMYEKWLKEGR